MSLLIVNNYLYLYIIYIKLLLFKLNCSFYLLVGYELIQEDKIKEEERRTGCNYNDYVFVAI